MKVKFTKLAALLLSGVALLAAGCTDYEVDIQKVDKKIDDLTTGKVATLENQVAALQATVATLETAADHKADIDKLNTTIDNLRAALQAAIDLKVDQSAYDAKVAEIEKRIKDIEDADFQKQINDLIAAMNTALAEVNTTIANTKAELEQKIADLELALNGKIGELEARVAANEAAIKKINEVTIPALQGQIDNINNVVIPAINQQIADLQSGKLDKAVFDDYVLATKRTLELMQAAIDDLTALTAGFPEDTTIKEYIDEADQALKDDFTAKYLDLVAKVFGTKEKMEAMEGNLLSRLEACEALLAGDWGGQTVKQYVDAKAQELQDQIDEINGKIGELDNRLTAVETQVYDVILPELEFAIGYEGYYTDQGGLQGYIQDWAIDAYLAACDYADEWANYLFSFIDDLYSFVSALQARIQSIVFVPDYDDLKITSNMAYVSQVVESEPQVRDAADADNVEKVVAVIDQPSKVTYKILPAQYAAWAARNYKTVLQFDIKPVATRADGDAEELVPEFNIIDYEYDENTVDETGEVTFTVMPVNVASAQFAANGLKPNYSLELYDQNGRYLAGGSEANWYLDEKYFGGFRNPEYGWDSWCVGVWDYNDLMAYEARTAFAASLRLKDQEGAAWNHEVNLYYGWDVEEDDDIFPEYNEVASTYNVLYPGVTEINILPDPYKWDKDQEGNDVLVKAVPEYQYLPYSALRKDGDEAVGEDPAQEPKGYRIILDGAIPAVEIDGTVMTIEQAAEAGHIVPAVTTAFDEFTYDKGKAAADLDKENFVETEKVYAEIEMNPEKSAAERKLAVGNIITGHYYFETVMGKTPFYGQVEITKPLGSVDASAEIIWTYFDEEGELLDALVDHNVFYETGEDPQIYSRIAYEVTLDEEDVTYLQEKLDIGLADFAKLTPNKFTVQVADRPADGTEPVFADLEDDDEFAIENVAIKDGKLVADIVDFEWDKIYKIVAVYNGLDENDEVIVREGMDEFPANITVTGIITTYDRNREKVVLGPYEHTFVVNDPEEYYDGYYHWSSEALHGDIFAAFDSESVINIKGDKLENGDFEYDAEQDEFNEAELIGKLRMANPSGTAAGYVDFNRNDIVLNTLSTLTPEVLAGDIFSSGERSADDPNLWLGNTVTRNVTTYIGEEVEIAIIFNYKVPDYNFLHLSYYTFNTDEEYTTNNFIQKYPLPTEIEGVESPYTEPIWWTQVNPSYFTTVKTPNTTEAEAQTRVSNRYALADYDVAYINLAELAFNVVDDKDEIIEADALAELGLAAKFIYTDEELGDVELPQPDKDACDNEFLLYKSLWVDNTTFYYLTNEHPYIPALGTLTLTVGTEGQGGYAFPVATRFEFPKNSVVYPEVELDYHTYAMVRWTPFQKPVAAGFTMVLDENKVYAEPLFKGMELKDNRPNDTHFYVIEDGKWVVGDAAEDATKTSTSNGYMEGIVSKDAYHIKASFDYSDVELPSELKKLLKIKYSTDEGQTFTDTEADGSTPYVVFDYTSEVQFRGTVTIPVVVLLENPWQETLKFSYNFIIKGVE